MTPAVRVFPDAPDTFACAELGCLFLEMATVAECERARCSMAYIRRREEDAIDRARKDEKQRTRDHA